MRRLNLLLFVIVAVLGFAVVYVAVRPMPAGLSEQQVRAIVSEAIASEPRQLTDENVRGLITAALAERESRHQSQSQAQIDPTVINPMIEDYLMSNPRILQQVSEALDREIRTAQAEQQRAAIAAMHSQIFDDPGHIVLGNPDGDVTLVEMFDYNCGYCRQALPDIAALLAEDDNLKVILKEFPILSDGSHEAAQVAVAFSKAGGDYWALHQKLFSSRSSVTGETALAAAQDLGMSRVSLELEMNSPEITSVIDRSYEIARNLGVTGTPTFIIGDEIIPGAIGIDALRARIASMRECGRTDCTAPASEAASAGS